MRDWKLEDARRLIWESTLSGANLEIANYWLSLWSSSRPPTRGIFDPKRIGRHLPAVAVMAVQPDESVTCRIAGQYGLLMSGIDLKNKSLLEYVPVDQRLQRLRNATSIVMGAISIAKRAIIRYSGEVELVDEICLPFADKAEDGMRHYLVHTNWRPIHNENILPEAPRTSCGFPEQANFLKLPTAHPDPMPEPASSKYDDTHYL